jgi:hypothetical protein
MADELPANASGTWEWHPVTQRTQREWIDGALHQSLHASGGPKEEWVRSPAYNTTGIPSVTT